MAKINIVFNNINYPIDESFLAASSATLQSHLSTVMSGSGDVIVLGGISYNIDSEKLASARNNFISRLGIISGNDYRIVIDGIEYGIDYSKTQSSVAEIEAVLRGLQNDDIEIRLLSSDNYILQDCSGLYIVPMEVE